MPQYEVNNTSIQSLLSWILNGEIAIPEIQRPFVWSSTKVRDLIDSLYTGYPVGYIIVWRNPDIKLKDGSISMGKKILIDGQQRITALRAAIAGKNIVDSEYTEKRIRIAFHPIEQRFEVCNPAIEKDSSWIPDIAKLFVPDFNSFDFVIDYCDKNCLDNTQRSQVSAVINKLQQVQNNTIGVIDLSHQLDINQVTEIFIRINSKGVVLSQADFAMSKIASDEKYGGNRTRKVLDYFCHLLQQPDDLKFIQSNDTEFTASEDFSKIQWVVKAQDDIYVPSYSDVLRVAFTYKFLRGRISDLVSLLSGRDFDSREYKEEIAEQSFRLLNEGVTDFINQTNFQRYLMILKSTGIIAPSIVRSQSALNFGYALYLLLKSQGENVAIIEKVVRRWVVLTILTGRYSGSTDSKIEYDIKHFQSDGPLKFLEHTEKGELSDSFWNHVLIDQLETSVASSQMFNVFLMAQIKAGDHGFLSEHIDVKTLIEQRGDVHHIFPKKYLQRCGIKSRNLYNQIANYVYTQSEINIKIKDQAPKEYMSQVKEQCTGSSLVYGGISSLEQLQLNLKENCIPQEVFDADYQHFEEFLKLRRVLMAQKIKSYYESLQ